MTAAWTLIIVPHQKWIFNLFNVFLMKGEVKVKDFVLLIQLLWQFFTFKIFYDFLHCYRFLNWNSFVIESDVIMKMKLFSRSRSIMFESWMQHVFLIRLCKKRLTFTLLEPKVIDLCHQNRARLASVWPGSILLAGHFKILILISQNLIMNRSKNGKFC